MSMNKIVKARRWLARCESKLKDATEARKEAQEDRDGARLLLLKAIDDDTNGVQDLPLGDDEDEEDE
jgi:hypothetical protein